jgi:hypothetical protein
MFYLVKLKWSQPKDGGDEMQKVAKQFLTYAESVTEADMRVNQWTPSNYQDAVVEEVKSTKIDSLVTKSESETYWLAKLTDDDDGKTKPKAFFVVINGLNLAEVVKSLGNDYYFADIEAIQKFKPIVDSDLTSTEIVKKELVDAEA